MVDFVSATFEASFQGDSHKAARSRASTALKKAQQKTFEHRSSRGSSGVGSWVHQDNAFDCGLFVVEYIRRMLRAGVLAEPSQPSAQRLVDEVLGVLYQDNKRQKPAFEQHDVTLARAAELKHYDEAMAMYKAAIAIQSDSDDEDDIAAGPGRDELAS